MAESRQNIKSLIICKSSNCKNTHCQYAHPIAICKTRYCNQACGKSHPPHNALKKYFCRFGRNCNYKNKGCLAQHDCPYSRHSYCSYKNCIYDHQRQHHPQQFGRPKYSISRPRISAALSTKDLACVLRGCHGNLCHNKYSHSNKRDISDKYKYYCQLDKACQFHPTCFNNHVYGWECDASPQQYICQFWDSKLRSESD
eukprot:UN07550